MKKLNGRGRRKKLPVVLTPEEQDLLLAALDPADTLARVRDAALVRLLLASGLRASEALALREGHLDLKRGRVSVVDGKGGKDRTAWINKAAVAAIQAWLSARGGPGPGGLPSGIRPVFTRLIDDEPLSPRWLRCMVKRVAIDAGIMKDVHPHTLRHTFACNLLRQEGNVFTVMRALGHEDLSTTQIYLSLEDRDLERAMKALGG